MYLIFLQNIFLYGNYVYLNFTTWLYNIIPETQEYETIPNWLVPFIDNNTEEEEEGGEEEEEQEEEQEEEEPKEQKEQKEEEIFTDLSKSWHCDHCTIFNTKYAIICQSCNIDKHVIPILEEIIEKICEENLDLEEHNLTLSISPATTIINKMTSLYNTNTNMDKNNDSDDMSIDLTDWAVIENAQEDI